MADLDDFLRRASQADAGMDSRTCELMMEQYYNFVFRLAVSFVGDADDADDAAQETFLRAATHLHQFQPGTSLKSWLAKITINVCRGRYRKQQAVRRLESLLKGPGAHHRAAPPTPEETLVENEQNRWLRQAVASLDEKHRMPVLLRYAHGMSVPEIAHALDEKEGTIHSRLHYAHQKLRDRLGSSLAGDAPGKAWQ